MTTLSSISPMIGVARPYDYSGGAGESTRICSTYALHLFLSGPGSMRISGRTVPLERGTLIFLRPGEVHSFHISPSQSVASNNIYCSLWGAGMHESTYPIFTYLADNDSPGRVQRPHSCPEFERLPSASSLQAFPHLIDQFAIIVKAFEQSSFYSTEISNSLLYSWLLQWYNALFSPIPTDQRIVGIMNQMEQQPDLRPTFGEWCERSGLEKSHFYKLFKQQTGMTPKAYLLRIKMRRAVELLQETSLSITAIAHSLGYESIHYFTKQFTDYHSISPTAFRSKR